ncbi:MAG TPA: hypothetical protein VFJ82_10050 [Longimicrobium sp.]|nr:hypothetical protein [Longimicrobium sp.]
MKKTLKAEDLAVSSFETRPGGTATEEAALAVTLNNCTSQQGCYPSQYCSLDGPYQLTCQPDCMTNANGYC